MRSCVFMEIKICITSKALHSTFPNNFWETPSSNRSVILFSSPSSNFPVTRGKTNARAPFFVETWRMKHDKIMQWFKFAFDVFKLN